MFRENLLRDMLLMYDFVFLLISGKTPIAVRNFFAI